MKKLLSMLMLGFGLVSIFVNTGYSQNIVSGVSDEQFTRTADEIIHMNSIKVTDVSLKAVRHFEKSFKEVEHVNWYKVKGGFMVYFYQEGLKKISGYSDNGKWLYAFFSYGEGKLPRPVWHEVKAVYYAYSIVLVNEIQTATKTIYVVHLEDDTTYKNVRICNDEMTEIQEIKKK